MGSNKKEALLFTSIMYVCIDGAGDEHLQCSADGGLVGYGS